MSKKSKFSLRKFFSNKKYVASLFLVLIVSFVSILTLFFTTSNQNTTTMFTRADEAVATATVQDGTLIVNGTTQFSLENTAWNISDPLPKGCSRNNGVNTIKCLSENNEVSEWKFNIVFSSQGLPDIINEDGSTISVRN